MRLNSQAVVRAVLAQELATYQYDGKPIDVSVCETVSHPRPDYCVLVRRESGSMQDAYLDRAGIGVFCWAPTEDEAADLASRAAEVMFSLEYKPGIASVKEEVFKSAPDTEDPTPRWYGSYTLITYEQRSK